MVEMDPQLEPGAWQPMGAVHPQWTIATGPPAGNSPQSGESTASTVVCLTDSSRSGLAAEWIFPNLL